MAKKDNIAKDNGKSPTVPVSTLAKLFNLTSVRVQQLAADGIIQKSGRGRYDLWPSVRAYIAYLQERKVNQWDGDAADPTEIKKQQLRRTKEEADKLELLNAKTRGELVEVEKIINYFSEIASVLKNIILNDSITEDAKDKCLRNISSGLAKMKNIK